MRRSYLSRQVFQLAWAATLPLLILLGVDVWQQFVESRRTAFQSVANYAQGLAGGVGNLLAESRRYVLYLAERPAIRSFDRRRCDPLLEDVTKRRAYFANVVVLDDQGGIVCSSLPVRGESRAYASTPWARVPSAGVPPDTSKPFLDPITGLWVVAVSQAVEHPEHERRGLVAVLLDLESAQEDWKRFALPQGSRLTVLDRDGFVAMAYPDFQKRVGQDLSKTLAAALRDNPGGIGIALGADGVSRAFARAPADHAGWQVVAGVPEDVVFAASRAALQRNVTFGLLVLALTLGMASLLARRLVQPLDELTATARQVAAGHLNARAPAGLPGEFGEVAEAVDRMLTALALSASELRVSERRHAELFENIGMLSLMFDPDLRVTDCNPFLSSRTGRTRDEVVGSSGFEQLVSSPTGRETARAALSTVMAGDTTAPHFDGHIESRNGEPLHVRWHASLMRDAESVVIGVALLGEDVTAAVQAREQERRHLDFYAALSRTNGAIVRLRDESALFQEICRVCVDHGHASIAYICLAQESRARAVAWAGPALRFIGESDFSLDPSRADGNGLTAQCVRSGERVVVNDVHACEAIRPWLARGERIGTRSIAAFPIRRDGEVAGALTLHMTITGFFDGRLIDLMDEVAGDLSFALDHLDRIESLRQTQARLEGREKQVLGLLETAMDAIITVGADHRIRMFNRAAAEMFGVPATEAIGQDVERFVPRRVQADHRAHIQSFARTGSTARRMGALHTLTGVRANGEEFPIEASISRLGDGAETLMTVVIRDATELRKAEAARLAQVAAESASRAKNDFLSRMSHELRTPLNAVLGFSQLLQSNPRAPLATPQLEQVEHIRRAGWHLLALINDVLDVSQIEAGKLSIREANVDLGTALAEAIDLSRPVADRHGITLVDHYRSEQALTVRADPVRLRQILINLLSNGAKYNRSGGTVALSAERSDGGVSIRVADTGLGMDAQQLAHLYEPFNRLGRERAQVEGTGLGLALTQQLVLQMNGRIDVDSARDVGTDVRIWLPAGHALPATGTSGPVTSPEAEGGPKGRVLYIEDNPVNLLLVEQLLARWSQVHLLQAPDGRSGIALAKSNRPDLVLLDMRLPDIDGPDVLKVLREDDTTRDLHVVALSASAMPEDIELARHAGADDYWTKPLDFAHFLREVERLLGQVRHRT